MGVKTINTKALLRNDTASRWTTNNPVLAKGEIGIESDTNKFKFGDGTTAWTLLPYAVDTSGKVDKVTNTDDGFKATILAVTLDSVVRKDAKEVLGPGIIDGVEYYEINMTDDVLEKIRNSLSAYEFNFIDDNGEYKLVSIEKI